MSTVEDPKLDLMLTPRVPQGLAQAVEGLTREVIRHRPENIYVFAADHFERLLRLREKYEPASLVNNENMKFVRDMNDSIKERCIYLESKKAKDFVGQSNWTLNEAADVLERHRSIFGESGKKIDLDEIRKLAKEQILIPPKIKSCYCKKKYEARRAENKERTEKHSDGSSSKTRESTTHYQSSKTDLKGAPKIIPQIPLVKDMKTELKRNRMSSRERKKIEEKKVQVSCKYSEYKSEKIYERTFKKSIDETRQNLDDWSEQKKNLRTEEVIKRRSSVTRKKVESPKVKKSSKKSMKMDEIRNYVVQNIAGLTSLDDLQSPSYIAKVQEVIDETSMIIKEKVEALKAGLMNAAKAKHSKSEVSSSNEEFFKSSSGSESNDASRANLFKSSSYQNISSKSEESSKRDFEAHSENSESLGKTEAELDQPQSKSCDHSNDPDDSNISLPVVRTPSSKSASRSVSARSHADSLVLPPISPESSKSAKAAEDLVLPVLSSPHSSSISSDSINCNEKAIERVRVKEEEEEFQDSLNGTPDLRDSNQRPDSLETSDNNADKSDNSGQATPLETLKDKLIEIEEAQKRIEDVLDDKVIDKVKNSNEQEDEVKVKTNIHEKLLEIEESEKRIEKMLDFQPSAVKEHQVINSDIKSKLQELEDTERRIENIFINEASTEYTNNFDTLTSNNFEEKTNVLTHENIKNMNENYAQQDSECKVNNTLYLSENNNDLQKKNGESTKINRDLSSPSCYVLTEGSPHDIPDSVTTVIIPDRSFSPDSDELEDVEIFSTLISSKEKNTTEMENDFIQLKKENKACIEDAFGEVINTANLETSTVDLNYICGIKMNHDRIIRKNLDQIQEEHDKEENAENIDSEDEKVLKVVTTSLEEILEKDKVEYVSKQEIQSFINNTFKKETDICSSQSTKVTEYESADETKETYSISDGYEENAFDIEENGEKLIEINSTFEKDINIYSSQFTKHTEYRSNDETRETYSVSDGYIENIEGMENIFNTEETTEKLTESTNESKETLVDSDRSSVSFKHVGPIVPELNLDSLPDLSISSFNITDDEQKEENKSEIKNEDSLEVDNYIDIKEKDKMSEQDFREKSSSEADFRQIENNNVPVIETLKETSILDVKKESSEFVETLLRENVGQLKKEEQDQLKLRFDEIDRTKNIKIPEKTSISETENIQSDCDEQIKTQTDTLSEGSINSDNKLLNIENIINNVPEENINSSNGKKSEDKEKSPPKAENRKDELRHEAKRTDSSSKEIENDPLPIEENYQRNGTETDQNNQFVDSSIVSSDTRNQLNSDNLLMETSADNIVETSYTRNISEIIKEAPIADETISNDFQVPETASAPEKEANRSATDDEKKHCHIYVPEMVMSKDTSSSTASSTFMSAATKIQAGIRGFLTRRRLQSTQIRSSTLDSIPSIELSAVADDQTPSTKTISSSSSSHLIPILGNSSFISESKSRKKLCREDALQRKTLSLENAFANNQVQHTGEFHDCIPLPVFDSEAFSLNIAKEQVHRDTNDNYNCNNSHDSPKESVSGTIYEPKKDEDKELTVLSNGQSLDRAKSSNVEQMLEKLSASSGADFPGTSKMGPPVDLVVLPISDNDMLQTKYLNFITSVEDIGNDFFDDQSSYPNSSRGVIIEEITSLNENKSKALEKMSEKENNNDLIHEKETTNESFSDEVARKSTRENSDDCTSNIVPKIDSQSSNLKNDGSGDNSVNKQTLSEVETLEIGSFEDSRKIEEKSDKDKNTPLFQKIENEKMLKKTETSSLTDFSISDEVVSMDIEDILGLGDDNNKHSQKPNELIRKSSMLDLQKSSSVSQERHLGDTRPTSPLTTMQIAPESVDEKNEKSDNDKGDESSNESNKLSA